MSLEIREVFWTMKFLNREGRDLRKYCSPTGEDSSVSRDVFPTGNEVLFGDSTGLPVFWVPEMNSSIGDFLYHAIVSIREFVSCEVVYNDGFLLEQCIPYFP